MSLMPRIEKKNMLGSRCILAGLFSAKDCDVEEKFELLKQLIEKNGGEVVGYLSQRRGVSRSSKSGGSKDLNKPMTPATYIGKGKVQELKTLVSESRADITIFLNVLSVTQIDRLTELTGCKVIGFGSA